MGAQEECSVSPPGKLCSAVKVEDARKDKPNSLTKTSHKIVNKSIRSSRIGENAKRGDKFK